MKEYLVETISIASSSTSKNTVQTRLTALADLGWEIKVADISTNTFIWEKNKL